jgi:hypothetical protein
MSQRTWREAEALSDAARWEQAGPAWQAIVERALRMRELARARDAATRAADAYRRDDRPAAAARMLRVALSGRELAGTDAAQLAAVLLDAGQVQAAAEVADQAVDAATDPTARTIALDTRVGLRLVRGDAEGARADLDALAALALPGGDLSRAFRAGQLDRLDGQLSAADATFARLAETLAPYAQLAGPAGAAHQERGELALLRHALGAPETALDDARAAFGRAGAAWAAAGRRAGLFRAEAWAARAAALAGETVAAPALDRALAYADERGLPMLAADLLGCRAVVRKDADDACAAAHLLTEAPLARGRARVLAAELGGPSSATVDLDAATAEVRADAPWTARALRARAARDGDARLAERAARLCAVLLG